MAGRPTLWSIRTHSETGQEVVSSPTFYRFSLFFTICDLVFSFSIGFCYNDGVLNLKK
uniref:Uncharacterized protein n=1 Tax=uncultured marine virus TaxID=186617 RepID=A0A0F7L0Q9_9VIRU|nr:hypothetical protein [uncultured marine virus]